ncbi:MAG: ATP-binding protein [Spartobacteria bacterium]
MKDSRRIVFFNAPSQLAGVRDGVRNFLHGEGFSEEEEARLTMAIDEACTNILRHSCAMKPARLEMKKLRHRLRFVLRDHGKPFHPPAVQPCNLKSGQTGGYGLLIIRTVFDRVDYAPQARGTRLTLEKLLP